MELNVIIKAIPTNVGRRETFRSADFFRNEINFYNCVWSKMMDFQKRKKLRKPFAGVPKCLASYIDGYNDFIVLEDLSADFSCARRQDGLDLNHCKLLLSIIGQFHAISLAMKNEEPALFQEMISSIEVSCANLYFGIIPTSFLPILGNILFGKVSRMV